MFYITLSKLTFGSCSLKQWLVPWSLNPSVEWSFRKGPGFYPDACWPDQGHALPQWWMWLCAYIMYDNLPHFLPLAVYLFAMQLFLSTFAYSIVLHISKSYPRQFLSFLKNCFRFSSSYVYGCLACMCVCEPCARLVLTEARRGHPMLWKWSQCCCEPPRGCWKGTHILCKSSNGS